LTFSAYNLFSPLQIDILNGKAAIKYIFYLRIGDMAIEEMKG
jgi:hypothetical protein